MASQARKVFGAFEKRAPGPGPYEKDKINDQNLYPLSVSK